MHDTGKGVADSIREILGPPDEWISLGVITSLFADELRGQMANVELRPTLMGVQCRIMQLGAGPSQGATFPVFVGQEILVFFPSGGKHSDTNLAVGVTGLHSGPALEPTSYDDKTAQFVLPGGLHVRKNEDGEIEGVVTRAFLLGLVSFNQTLFKFMSALAADVTNPAIAAAAAAFIVDPGFTQFVTDTGVSSQNGGQKPYASETTRTE